VATEEGVAAGREHLEDAIADLEDRAVEGAAAEVVDGESSVERAAETVGQGGRGRLVEDAEDLQPGELPGELGGLALGIGEVGRHGDDRAPNRQAQVAFGAALE